MIWKTVFLYNFLVFAMFLLNGPVKKRFCFCLMGPVPECFAFGSWQGNCRFPKGWKLTVCQRGEPQVTIARKLPVSPQVRSHGFPTWEPEVTIAKQTAGFPEVGNSCFPNLGNHRFTIAKELPIPKGWKLMVSPTWETKGLPWQRKLPVPRPWKLTVPKPGETRGLPLQGIAGFPEVRILCFRS